MRRRVDVKSDHVVHLGGNCGSRLSLKVRNRCGARPWARQIFCTVLIARPMTSAIARLVQCVVSPGGAPSVRSTSCATLGSATGALPGLRVLSCNSASTPASIKRRCQRRTQGFETPARRMISAVPQPAAVARTICARHTCFCARLRSATTASSRSRSPGPSRTSTSRGMPGQDHKAQTLGIFCIVHTTIPDISRRLVHRGSERGIILL
jgi:hypothetical protein